MKSIIQSIILGVTFAFGLCVQARSADIALVPHLSNNTALSSTKSTTYPYVIRDAFSTAGDSPPAFYQASNSACPLNAGAGDGGSQIPSSDSKCWLLIPQYPLDPAIWGIGPNSQVVFYASPTGNDANNYCLSSSAPCQHAEYAFSRCTASLFHNNGINQFVSLANGTYNETIFGNTSQLSMIGTNGESETGCGLVGQGAGTILAGDGINCGSVIASGGGSFVFVRNLQLIAVRAACQSALYAQLGGHIAVYDGVTFGNANGGHFIVEEVGSMINVWNSYTVNGTATNHIGMAGGDFIYNGGGMTITVNGNPTMNWISAQGMSHVHINGGTTFTGTLNGAQYILAGGPEILMQSNAPQPLPGNPALNVITNDSGVYPEYFVTGALPTITTQTGTGTTGGTTLAFGDSKRGVVAVSPNGTGIQSNGGFTLVLPTNCQAEFNQNPTPVITLEGFLPGASGNIGSVSGRNITVQWVNRDANDVQQLLVAGSHYFVNYVCP